MKTTQVDPHKSSLGMDANIAVLVIYIAMGVVGWIPFVGWVGWAVPLVFFMLEKTSQFVKFHAVQALVIGVLRSVLLIIFQVLIWVLAPSILTGGWALFNALYWTSAILGLALTALMVLMIVLGLTWKEMELPIAGPMARKAAEKVEKMAAERGINMNLPGQPQQQSYSPQQGFQAPQQPADQQYQPPAAQTYQPPTAQSYLQPETAPQPYQPPAQTYQAPAQTYQPPAQPYQPPAAPSQPYQPEPPAYQPEPPAQPYQPPAAQSYQPPQPYQPPTARSYEQPAQQPPAQPYQPPQPPYQPPAPPAYPPQQPPYSG